METPERVKIKNEEGIVRMVFQRYQGILWPLITEDPVKALDDTRNFQYKDGDLFVCSYPRTGSQWTVDMLTMLRNNTTDINDTMAIPIDIDLDHNLSKTPPRTILTHMPFRFMPEAHVRKGGKIILLHRNPKDTAVSNFYFSKENKVLGYTGDFGEFLQYFMTGQTMYRTFYEHYREWDETLKENPKLPVLILRYEDLKQDCVSQLRRICDFLELERPDTFLQEVAQKSTIDQIKAAKEASPDVQRVIDLTSDDGTFIFYRKGLVGDWKTHFTVAQSEKFDEIFGEQLEDTIFPLEY